MLQNNTYRRGLRLKIAVFIKQVPDTTDVKWTANNNIDRANMDSVMNPVDKEAIEAALKIKEKIDATVVAVTMGPKKAEEVLKEAIAMGVDDAILLCDSKFAGSDTLATSKILSASVKEFISDTDLIIFGQSAADGETGQTGPCVAARLDWPCISRVSDILEISDKAIVVLSETEKERIKFKSELPVVLCINNYVHKPRIPRICGYINAQKYNYISYNLYDVNLSDSETGLKGSPTYVSKVFKCEDTRNGKIFDADETQFSEIYEEIKKVL